MDINTSNNINSINNVQNSALERIATGLAINSASDNSSTLAIVDALEAQRSTLNQSLGNVNSGIAMSNIAQGGITEQKNILNEVNTLTLEAMNGTTNQEGREAIKDQISSYMEQFDAIAQNTNYNGQQLLSGEEKDLSIITDEDSTIEMKSTETKDISDTIKSFLNNFTTSSTARENLLNATKDGMTQLSQKEGQFASAAVQMESAGRNALSSEAALAEASSTLIDVDYGKAISDFSSSNLMAQIGILASTQANAIQQRNVALLS